MKNTRNVTGLKGQILKNMRNSRNDTRNRDPSFSTPLHEYPAAFKGWTLLFVVLETRIGWRGEVDPAVDEKPRALIGEFKIFKKPNPEKKAPYFSAQALSSFFYHLIRALNNPLYASRDLVSWKSSTQARSPTKSTRHTFKQAYMLRKWTIFQILWHKFNSHSQANFIFI